MPQEIPAVVDAIFVDELTKGREQARRQSYKQSLSDGCEEKNGIVVS